LDVKNKKCISEWNWKEDYIYREKISKMTDSYLITGKDCSIQIRDINTGEMIRRLEFKERIIGIAAISDDYLALNFISGEIQFWG